MLFSCEIGIYAPAGSSPWAFSFFGDAVVGRPRGFQEFINKKGFHSLYLVTTDTDNPVKVGIAKNPEKRMADIQTSNFVSLRMHRFWWMPGKPVTARIECAFKCHFQPQNVRGEWFDLSLSTAEAFIETSIRCLGTWGVRQSDLVGYMDHQDRQKYGVPLDAPTPLRGVK